MPNSNDFPTGHTENILKNTSLISGKSTFLAEMAASKSGSTASEAQPSSNTSKNTENSLIKHQGQKWQQVFDFDKMLKQLRSSTSEKQHHRSKNDTSSSSKSSSSNSSSQSSKSGSSSNSKNGRSIRQVQRLNGNDMHYYGIVPKKASADVIVCSICRGIYTMVGFSNHMIMQHPTAWGAVSSKLTLTTSNEMFNIISNDNSQDCLRDGTGSTAPTDILGSPSDLSGIMSTSSNASSSSSSISTTSSTYAATPRHKSSKSGGGTTAGSSSSGGSSSTSGSRSRSKQSRHGSNNNNNNHHTASVGIHTSGSAAGTENTQAQSKSSKKSNNSNSSSGSNANNNSKTENISKAPALVATTASSTVNATIVTNSGKHSKESAASLVDTVVTTPIAIYSSSSNSSCSLPPTPKLSTPLTEVKSPAFVAQESAESSVSSSSIDFERLTSTGKSLSAKSATNASGKTTKTIASISSTLASRESSKAAVVKEMSRFEPTQLTELDQAVSSITENTSKSADKKVDVGIKNVMEANTNIIAAGTNNIFQIPTTTVIADNSKEKLQAVSMMSTSTNNNNMNVNVQTVLPANYVVPQDAVQNCEEPLPHNASDDNSILTFDDMFDSKFINEILSTADTDIQFDENELDRATVAQQQQQQQQQQQVQEQHQVYQQQVSHSAKRMRYDESLLANGQQQQQQQHLLQQQQTHSGVEITGEFVTYQQQQQQHQQQQQYVPYNVTTLEDLKLFNSAGQLVEPHQQQMQAHLQHGTEQQQQQLTAIDAMQLQQLLYQQQTMNSHYDTNMIDNTTDPNNLALQQQQQQQYDQSGVVSAKQLMEMCATVDMKPNKMGEFTTAAYDNCYDNMASHFQLSNVPSLTDDTDDAVVEQVNAGNEAGMLMPNIVNGLQRGTQQYVLPGGAGEDHLIYEITDNNQVAVISQQRQQQMLNEFLTQANYEQVTTDMNVTTAPTTLDTTQADGATLLQQHNSGSNVTMMKEESAADVDEDLLDFDYSLMETYKTLSSSGSAGGSSSSSGGGSSSKAIKIEGNNNASNSSKYYDDGYLNTYLYPGVPKPSAVNCFGLVKLPFAAATTFRKHILNARKANNSPITLSGGGGINGIVCSNSSTAARLTSNTKSMQNYFSNLTSTSNSLGGNEFSIGSITITNSSSSQNHLYAAQQKQQNAGNNNTSSAGNVEITFNTNSNGCGSAMSPVSTLQRSRTKSGNSASAATGGVVASSGGATLVRSKSQTGAPIAIVAPTSRLPPPPRPSTAGPVLAQSNKTIFIGNNTSMNGVNDRVKFIKRCMPLTNSNNTNNNNSSRLDTAKRQKFSPRQIADFLGGVSNNNNNANKQQKSSSAQQNAEVGTNGNSSSINSGNNNHEAVTNNASVTTNYNTASADDQLKLERVAHFYERRRKLYDMARNSRQQQQQHQQQRSQQQPHVQQKLLKQQQQLFKMLTDYGQLNAVVGNCKGANANANPGSNNNNSGSEVLRISV